MIDEKPEIKKVAILLNVLYGTRNSHDLRAGNLAFHSTLDPDKFRAGEYDDLFDSNPDFAPDGVKGNGDPAMFVWRDHVEQAMAVIEAVKTQ